MAGRYDLLALNDAREAHQLGEAGVSGESGVNVLRRLTACHALAWHAA